MAVLTLHFLDNMIDMRFVTGSHEVDGSIPFSSTNNIKDLWYFTISPFFFHRVLGAILGANNRQFSQDYHSAVGQPSAS